MRISRKQNGWLSFTAQVAVLDAALLLSGVLLLEKYGPSAWHSLMVRGLMHYCTFLCG